MKKKIFVISLIIIYLLFLAKNTFFKYYNNMSSLKDYTEEVKESFYQKEYLDITKMLKLEASNFKVVYSKVVLRNIYDFYDVITISKGLRDGVQKGNVVVNELGVVGVIKEIHENYSEVSLLTNNETNISVKINNVYGILSGKDKKIIVKNVTEKLVKVGDMIYTSGLTDIPGGIKIGKIKSIQKDSLGLEYIIEVEASANINHLNYVGVVKS